MAIDFSKVLNPEQCAAATAGDGPILVLAAAGTGKTRTLVHRVAYLVEKGVPPERILLLTFTNRAANEMLERAQRVVPGVTGIWSGTFHSICNKFLRRWGRRPAAISTSSKYVRSFPWPEICSEGLFSVLRARRPESAREISTEEFSASREPAVVEFLAAAKGEET